MKSVFFLILLLLQPQTVFAAGTQAAPHKNLGNKKESHFQMNPLSGAECAVEEATEPDESHRQVKTFVAVGQSGFSVSFETTLRPEVEPLTYFQGFHRLILASRAPPRSL